MQKLHFPFLKQFMHCIFWKFLVVSTENKFLFEDSFNVLFVRIIFLWFFMIFIMAYLWKGFSCGFYDFLHAIFVVMVFVVFCFNPLWFLWFLWFLWSLTFYSLPGASVFGLIIGSIIRQWSPRSHITCILWVSIMSDISGQVVFILHAFYDFLVVL